MDEFAVAALTVAEYRLADIARRNVHIAALVDVGDRALGDDPLHRAADLLLVATQEALAIDRALVPACEPPVDEVIHWDLRTLRYHSQRRRTCFSV